MYKDLREWLKEVEAIGELKKIGAEVDWNEEMGAITYIVGSKMGSPALLFENVKGYGPGKKVLFNMMGSSENRIALAMGLKPGLSTTELILQTRDKIKRRIPPKVIDSNKAPVKENYITGDAINLFDLPAPKMWPLDGGRYLGTGDVIITKDPDTGVVNLGTYRQMIQDKDKVGFYSSPGKDVVLHREKYWKKGEPCPVVAVYGIDPLMLMCGSQGFPRTVSEYDVIGGVKEEAVEVITGEFTGLPIPAYAEIVIEGFSYPGATMSEGPFGEFQGYYGRPEADTPYIEVKAIYHRNNPILTSALMADYPACEQNAFFSIIRSAKIWDDLDALGIPGIHGVFSHPAAAGGFGMIIVSMEQHHAGHAPQVLALTAQCPGAAYIGKWIITVDEDIDPTDINRVIWAMATRCNPIEDIDFLRNTWSTWLDPTQNPPEKRPYGSKALINACKEHRNIDVFSKCSRVTRKMYDHVSSRWSELNLDGAPPVINYFEE